MLKLGHDTQLVPTYTPITTDEVSVSADRLFYGGLNVYLQQISPLFRWLPRWADSVLSKPRLVNWIAGRSMGTTADKLGPLTVSMLRGTDGYQRKEVERLCKWLRSEQPDVVVFSNLLIAGGIEKVKKELGCPVVVVLQGDDIFYNSLLPKYRDLAIEQLRQLAEHVDTFVVNSKDYALRMQGMLGFSEAQTFISPLTIDTSDFQTGFSNSGPGQDGGKGSLDADRTLSIGYLARLAPEKGLHQLVDGFISLVKNSSDLNIRLDIAGWLGGQNQSYWEEQQVKLSTAGLEGQYRYWGSVDRPGKLEFLRSIDLLCVPTVSEEPKGLFALEAMAAGLPVVLPAHGSFPEMLERYGGGQLFTPGSAEELVTTLSRLLSNADQRRQLGQTGRCSVMERGQTHHEASNWLAHFETLIRAE